MKNEKSHGTRNSVNRNVVMKVHGMLQKWPLPGITGAQLNSKGIAGVVLAD